jgi:hypothetical protein
MQRLPREVLTGKPPEPSLKRDKLFRINLALYQNLVRVVQRGGDEVGMIDRIHNWMLNYVVMTTEQKFIFRIATNNPSPPAKMSIYEIWRYHELVEPDSEGRTRIPDWIENVTELMSQTETNILYRDTCLFACHYWISQQIGTKDLNADQFMFLWDIEHRLLDLKCPKLVFPRICKVGPEFGIMTSMENIYPVGEDPLNALIHWAWEIHKVDWVVENNITNKLFSLKGMDIFTFFNKYFKQE